MKPLEIAEYKGCNIEIYQDESADGPDKWENTDLFLTAYHRDFTVESKIVSKAESQALFTKNPDEYEVDMYRYNDLKKKYHTFGLEAYIHGGVCLALSREGNFPDRQWDVSQLGVVFVSKKEFKSEFKARNAARGLIENWNHSLSGEIYGYMAKTKNGKDIDSCWGYYGDYEKNGMMDDAKIAIDSSIAKKKT